MPGPMGDNMITCGWGSVRTHILFIDMTDIKKAIKAYNETWAASAGDGGREAAHRFDPQAVLFDMDGVLYDSMPRHAVAWQQSMAQFGLTMTAADAYATEGARGIDTIRQFVKQQQGRDISLDEAQKIYDVKTEIYHSLGDTPIFDGVISLMRQIKAAGMRIGIVTGSGQRPLIARTAHDFEAFLTEVDIVSAYDVKRGKPNPDPYLMGLEKMGGLEPWQGIVVENAPLGVRAGVTAKIFTVAINSGPLPDEALLSEGANLLYPSIARFAEVWPQLMESV